MSFMAYFVDARAASIQIVTIRHSSAEAEIRGLIGSPAARRLPIKDHHLVFHDGKGLMRGMQSVSEIEGMKHLLGGNFVITGLEMTGRLTSPLLPVAELARRIRIVRPILDPVVPSGDSVAAQITFRIRIVRQRPKFGGYRRVTDVRNLSVQQS